jgi:hypothetical protein
MPKYAPTMGFGKFEKVKMVTTIVEIHGIAVGHPQLRIGLEEV